MEKVSWLPQDCACAWTPAAAWEWLTPAASSIPPCERMFQHWDGVIHGRDKAIYSQAGVVPSCDGAMHGQDVVYGQDGAMHG